LKILFCNYEYPPVGGGGGVITAWIAEELAKRHEVTVLTSQCLGQERESVENGVRVIRIPVLLRKNQGAASFTSLLSFVILGLCCPNRFLKDKTFDVINTHFVLPTGPVGHLLAKKMKIANILSVHGGDLYDPSKPLSPHQHWFFRIAVRYLLKAADLVVAQSNNTRNNVHKIYLPELSVDIIPLAIQRPPPPKKTTRQEFGIGESDIVLVTVGRLVARKQVNKLIKAVSDTARKDIRVIVIGDGPREKELREQAKSLGIASQVHFLGYIKEEEKNKILSLSDMFVSTSEHEGFGIVFLEAMSHGLPIICFNHGGQVDFLKDGNTGFLIPLNDLSIFAEKLNLLANNKELRLKMKANCLALVENYYIDTCAKKYEDRFLQHCTPANCYGTE